MPTFLKAASFTNASRAGNLRHLTYAAPCGGLVLGVPRERKASVGRYEHTRAALQALPQPLWGYWERRGAMSTVVYHRVFLSPLHRRRVFYSAIYSVDYLAKSMQKKYPIALSPAKTLSDT